MERHASHCSDLAGGAWIREDTEEASEALLSGLAREREIEGGGNGERKEKRVSGPPVRKGYPFVRRNGVHHQLRIVSTVKRL